MDIVPSGYRWVRDRWKKASPLLRIGYILVLVVLVTVGVGLPLFASPAGEVFAKLHPTAQATILLFLFVGWVVFLLLGWDRAARVDQLKEENAKLKEQLQEAQDEEERRLRESEAGVWHRPCEVAVPGMLPKGHRDTRFVAVLNFKGGVGKTTLAANVAAGLATGRHPLRVLLIDLDRQGTLGRETVDPSLIGVQSQHGAFVNRLLLEPPADGLLAALAVQMSGVPGAKVVLANDKLAIDDFQLQAQFFLDPSVEPRYQFRKHLHRPEVFARYDLVVFDCPPAITTSAVNAVACSDYVVVPTCLDRGSIAAVPRMSEWMRNMNEHCPAEVLGVVACRAKTWRGQLTKADAKSFENLREAVKSACGGDLLLKAYVPDRPEAVGPEPGHVASLTPDGRAVFAPVVAELRKRMGL